MTEIRDCERRFAPGGGVVRAGRRPTRDAVAGGVRRLPARRCPRTTAAAGRVPRQGRGGGAGIGIGWAGLPSYNMLLEGHTDALENDVVIYMKQAQTPAVSRHITDPAVRGYFQHEGHRTATRSGPSRRTPTRGWAGPSWTARASWSPRCRRTRWTWTGRDVEEPGEIAAVVADLGRATATMHAAADDESGHGLVGSPPRGPSTRRSPRTRTASRRMLVDFAHATAPGPAPTTRSSWTCSATGSSRTLKRKRTGTTEVPDLERVPRPGATEVPSGVWQRESNDSSPSSNLAGAAEGVRRRQQRVDRRRRQGGGRHRRLPRGRRDPDAVAPGGCSRSCSPTVTATTSAQPPRWRSGPARRCGSIRRTSPSGTAPARPPAVDGDPGPRSDRHGRRHRPEVMHTPGHTPGAVTLSAPALGVVFTGDTLFQGGPGATGRSYSRQADEHRVDHQQPADPAPRTPSCTPVMAPTRRSPRRPGI